MQLLATGFSSFPSFHGAFGWKMPHCHLARGKSAAASLPAHPAAGSVPLEQQGGERGRHSGREGRAGEACLKPSINATVQPA